MSISSMSDCVSAFVALGDFFRDLSQPDSISMGSWHEKARQAMIQARQRNGWFDEKSILLSFKSWSLALTQPQIENWLNPFKNSQPPNVKKVGLVLAGNIPMVGLHDVLCGLVSGHQLIIRCSREDDVLIPLILDFLVDQNPAS